MKRLIISLIAIAAIMSGCSSTDDSAFKSVPVTEFAELIASQEVVIIDVRTPQEFNDGHIAGAINIDVASRDFNTQIATLDPTLTYAVYCRSGRRSASASKDMTELGFTSVFNMNGGTLDWESEGFPLVQN